MTHPYRDTREHLRDELKRLDLLLWRHLVVWRTSHGGTDHGGLYVSDEQVDRLLRPSEANHTTNRTADSSQTTDRRPADSSQTTDRRPTDSSQTTDRRPAGNPDGGVVDPGEPVDSSGGPVDSPREPIGHPGEAAGSHPSDASDPAGSAHREAAPAGSARREADVDSLLLTADVDARLRTLTETIENRTDATGDETDLRLVTLRERFDLNRRQLDALLVALGPELDLKYEQVYAYLQDDLTRMRPTVGLVVRVLDGTAGDELDGRPVFSQESPLRSNGLVGLSGADGSFLSQFVEVDRRIVWYLLGEDDLDPALAEVTTQIDGESGISDALGPFADDADGTPIDRLALSDPARQRVSALAERVADGEGAADVVGAGDGGDTGNGNRPTLAWIHGPEGSGRRAVAAAVTAELDVPLLSVDARKLPPDGTADLARRLVRESRLADAAVCVHHVPDRTRDSSEEDAAEGTRQRAVLTALLSELDASDCPVFLTSEAEPAPSVLAEISAHDTAVFELGRPSFTLRRALWERMDLPAGVDPAELAAKFAFTPGQIEAAVSTARSRSAGELAAETLYEGCRLQSRERLDEIARKVEPTYTWEDIVLPEDVFTKLREVAAHVEHQGRVFEDWGFADTYSLGNGVNVMFSGPSGTGKTMAAEIVAGSAGLDLYKVDLASVVSKYIGETESNLQRIFDEAETSNAVLFFDEADALFGERSEVRDSHDRYANVEVNYLLQRMEAHDGVVILATNLKENIDDAFRRRINVSLEFPLPERDLRERIWRSIFPVDTPVGDLDWAFLAEFELTGGNVKNAALAAAFLAADEGEAVEMHHVVRAVHRELEKTGRLISMDDFGPYREFL